MYLKLKYRISARYLIIYYNFWSVKIFFTVNGFSPNGNVHWEFIDSKGNIDSYGYFETDEFGGFEEYIIAEVIKPDIYTLRFFDDKNNNFLKDFNGSEVIINYQVPCANPIF